MSGCSFVKIIIFKGCLASTQILYIMQPILLNFPQYYISMEKHTWQQALTRSQEVPSQRWGHASVLANNRLIIFGGYANSNYMGDLWAFDTINATWQEWKTTGAQPEARSNSTLHFDEARKRLIMFGGGGVNKTRYGDVRSLDLNSKEWTLLAPKEGDRKPWDRTYHTSELLYPYLFVFGGEAISDMDDLWTFHLETQKWLQVPINKEKGCPGPRRFHCSAMLGTTLYIIAGCHDKYRCYNDIFSINLHPFTKNINCAPLQWREISVKGSSYLTRWGHSVAVFDNKIFIFGGRFSSDLNDLLLFDTVKETVKPLKARGKLPQPRRRCSTTFIGASLAVFGGFSGSYFNDLFYINLYEPAQPKVESISQWGTDNRLNWINKPFLSDLQVLTKDGREFHAHKGLIIDKFREKDMLDEFMKTIDGQYSLLELTEMFQILYSGVGSLKTHPFNIEAFSFNLYDTYHEKEDHLIKFMHDKPFQSLSLQPIASKNSKVITLSSNNYNDFVDSISQMYDDFNFVINGKDCLTANKVLLAASCEYFQNLFKYSPACSELHFVFPYGQFGGVEVFQVMLNYLHTGYLVVPDDLDEDWWMRLLHLGEYFCFAVSSKCEGQLIQRINNSNRERLLEFSLGKKLDVLKEHCLDALFRDWLKEDCKVLKEVRVKKEKTVRQAALCELFELWEFDFTQNQLRKKSASSSSKDIFGTAGNKENTFNFVV